MAIPSLEDSPQYLEPRGRGVVDAMAGSEVGGIGGANAMESALQISALGSFAEVIIVRFDPFSPRTASLLRTELVGRRTL
jgi:hypothetical protein